MTDAVEQYAAFMALGRRMSTAVDLEFGCGPGWFGIIADLHDRLMQVDPSYEFNGLRQKDGELRFYALCTDERQHVVDGFEALVGQAEDASRHVCERCGEPGEHQQLFKGLFMTRCDECATREREERG